MFFLKIFDDREKELELLRDHYQSPLPAELRWSAWAADPEGITGNALLDFVNGQLLPRLKILGMGLNDRISTLVRTTFEGANNYMKNGTLMRQVVNRVNGIDFNASDDRHLFGDIYEKLLKDLQSAGNSGEFYTPRAVTQFIVEQVNPRLGESVLDPACGTGWVSGLRHRAPAQAGQDGGGRAHGAGKFLGHREKAPAPCALHDQPCSCTASTCPRPYATTTRWPDRCVTGVPRSALT